jgi:hypothetical protein
VLKQSYIINQQFEIDEPSFFDNLISKNVVEDQQTILFARTGITEITNFYIMEKQALISSAFTDYANDRYKFIGY